MRDRSKDLVIHVRCNADGTYTATELMHGVVSDTEKHADWALDHISTLIGCGDHSGDPRSPDAAFIDCIATLDERRFRG